MPRKVTHLSIGFLERLLKPEFLHNGFDTTLNSDSETNRIAVQSCIESVVKEFGLKESLKESNAQMSYLSRHFLNGEYSLSASISRERWQFSADDLADFE